MVLMWAAGTAVVAGCFGLSLLPAALIGAILTPTDPVLSAPVVSGALARRSVPSDLRHALNAESGINDGLAQPFVMIALFAILAAVPGDSGHGVFDWIWHVLLQQVGMAIVFGAAAGYVARRLMRLAARRYDAERSSLLTIALALALATLSGLQAVGGNGVLGAFIAGAVLNGEYDAEYEQHQEHFNEAISRFFDLPVMVLLGVAAPWHAWMAMGWRAPAFVAGLLLLRRIPAWLLLGQFMPWTRGDLWASLFSGWFGPVGTAALFYATEMQDQTGLPMIWPIVSLAAAASVVAHGVTGTHLSIFLGRAYERQAALQQELESVADRCEARARAEEQAAGRG